MKTAVIYHSQTGFTKRYAQWIAQEAGAGCFPLSEAKKMDLAPYDAIVFGSWACAGGISRLGWFKGSLDRWAGKRLAVFCVGAAPAESPEILPALRKNFSPAELERVALFYCPGGFNYERMPTPSRLMMKVFIQANKAKKDKTAEDEERIRMISSSYDISDKKYIEPILQYLNGG